MKIQETKPTEITIPHGVEVTLDEDETLYVELDFGWFAEDRRLMPMYTRKFKIVKDS